NEDFKEPTKWSLFGEPLSDGLVTQKSQLNMRDGVEELGEDPEVEEVVGVFSWVVVWNIDVEEAAVDGDQRAAKHPVVEAVLEQVEQWHSGVGESVDKHVLDLSLEVVDDVQLVDQLVLLWLVEDVVVSNVMKDQRTQVLDQVHCSPADLWTKILDGELLGG
ncbi:hypothetical protein WICPIJ_001350, partial [Wickerhamomyces pijperi]